MFPHGNVGRKKVAVNFEISSPNQRRGTGGSTRTRDPLQLLHDDAGPGGNIVAADSSFFLLISFSLAPKTYLGRLCHLSQ